MNYCNKTRNERRNTESAIKHPLLTIEIVIYVIETKGKSENQKANLEMVLESISEDIRVNADTTAKLFDSIENLSQKTDYVVSDKNELQSEREDFSKEMTLGFAKISESISKFSFSLDRLQKIAEISERNSRLQKNTQETKVIHHHHISREFWVAIIFFNLLALESAGWQSDNDPPFDIMYYKIGDDSLKKVYYTKDSIYQHGAGDVINEEFETANYHWLSSQNLFFSVHKFHRRNHL